ncbi:hypothetical protein [Pseudomonas sp. TWP3-1]|uniref:hypothetical protein n=1 Tax=Pseudomonas sp. TWP3-1 TaxID=2804631 RepID=UPI003CF5FDFA
MELRLELMPPQLDESAVTELAELAAEIDGGCEHQTVVKLAEFNRRAMTNLRFIDFQGIYGGQDHDTWVRQILAQPYEKHLTDITVPELVELARRIMECDGAEHAIGFWLNMLELNLPNERISDLIYWPGEYFGDGDNMRELTPEQVIDIALKEQGSARNYITPST